jgi:hypothetical protein
MLVTVVGRPEALPAIGKSQPLSAKGG